MGSEKQSLNLLRSMIKILKPMMLFISVLEMTLLLGMSVGNVKLDFLDQNVCLVKEILLIMRYVGNLECVMMGYMDMENDIVKTQILSLHYSENLFLK